MTITSSISASDVRDYAKATGWAQDARAVERRLFVLNHAEHQLHQLVLPMDSSAPDFSEAVGAAVGKLASIESRSVGQVVRSIQELHDDALSFRIISRRLDDSAIPLKLATAAIEGTEQLLLAAASSVTKPQRHHPRLGRAAAQELIRQTRFRHTEPGSFIIKVSCRLPPAPPFDPEFVSFERQATLLVSRSVNKLVNAIEGGTVESLIESEVKSPSPILSSNFCEALLGFQSDEIENDLEISSSWSPLQHIASPDIASLRPARIKQEYFKKIDEVRRALRTGPTVLEDSFVGTVEELEGEMGEDNKRSGFVTLALLVRDSDRTISARVNLNAEQYVQADKAHMTPGKYVLIAGKLKQSRQPYIFEEVTKFGIVGE